MADSEMNELMKVVLPVPGNLEMYEVNCVDAGFLFLFCSAVGVGVASVKCGRVVGSCGPDAQTQHRSASILYHKSNQMLALGGRHLTWLLALFFNRYKFMQSYR